MGKRERLDRLLVERGLVATREEGRSRILAGEALVDDQPVAKAGSLIDSDAVIRLKGKPLPYVSRGGTKLEKALKEFRIEVQDRIVLDVGASTGGFTDCLLAYGAHRVYAVDVGYGQLDWRLRKDPRVLVLEKRNIRYLKAEELPQPPQLATIDVSFISLRLVLPQVKRLLASKGEILALIKPQFEVGKGKVGKGGVVRCHEEHLRVIEEIKEAAAALKLEVCGVTESPLLGPKGNREFFIYLAKRCSLVKMTPRMFVREIACPRCQRRFPLGKIINLCPCGSPLLVRYDLKKMRRSVKRSVLKGRPPTLWRYREFLPLRADDYRISLGEGFTPLIEAARLASELNIKRLWIKDEAQNPTGSFKDRGLSVAISLAKELGVKKVAAPSAGNAGGSLAAYAARAGMEAYVFMPKDTPKANQIEVEKYGARLVLVDGLIHDCGRLVSERKDVEGWFDVSTLKEPYRVEGKKTIGLEIAEQLKWKLPDVIIYPTGGGTGLIGMWKGFKELEEVGWIGSKRPRMVSVQAEHCAPIVRAFNEGKKRAEPWPHARTIASGLRVPQAVADFLMLEAIRESKGTALSVSDQDMIAGIDRVGRLEGLLFCPEGGAGVAALQRLVQQGWVKPSETVLIFNTASGLKYIDVLSG